MSLFIRAKNCTTGYVDDDDNEVDVDDEVVMKPTRILLRSFLTKSTKKGEYQYVGRALVLVPVLAVQLTT